MGASRITDTGVWKSGDNGDVPFAHAVLRPRSELRMGMLATRAGGPISPADDTQRTTAGRPLGRLPLRAPLIHRAVRLVDQLFESRVRPRWADRVTHTDTCRPIGCPCVVLGPLGHDRLDGLLVGVIEQYTEFVAAPASDLILLTEPLPQLRRNLDQQRFPAACPP